MKSGIYCTQIKAYKNKYQHAIKVSINQGARQNVSIHIYKQKRLSKATIQIEPFGEVPLDLVKERDLGRIMERLYVHNVHLSIIPRLIEDFAPQPR